MLKVEILPAAVNSLATNEYLGVKYGASKKHKPFTAERRRGLYTMYLPDRTVYVGRGNSNTLGISPVEIDSLVVMSPLSNPSVLKSMGINYMMVTPERMAGSDYVRRNGEVKLFSDSGGFQLSKGVTEFIDLDHISAFYAKKIDYGIGLDVPLPRHMQSSDWMMRMCKVMIANDKYIAKKIKGTGAELYDVSHGLTVENRKRFLSHVLDHKVGTGLAMGGIGQANYDTANISIVTAILNLSYVLDASKGIYDKFHVLGTTSPFMVSAYHILTKLDVAPKITADSSTYAQAGLAFNTRGTLYCSTSPNVPSFVLDDLSISFGLPCNCAVCSLASYPQVYRMSQTANCIHTLSVMNKMSKIAGEYVTLLLEGKPVLETLIKFVAPNPASYPIYRALYKFLLDMDKGFDKAFKKHKDILNLSIRKEYGGTGLFKRTGTLPPALKKAEANVTQAIIRYEKFHGIGPKTTKGKAKSV